MKTSPARLTVTAIALSFPVILLYAAHVFHAWRQELHPTGFIQYDQPYYMANAHQYVDGEHNGLAYSNPFDFDPASPRIYFQPLIFAFGLLLRLTGADPGFLYALFGLLCTVVSFVILQRFLNEYIPSSGTLQTYLVSLVAWGGGCLVLLGLAVSLARGEGLHLFAFDPFGGSWFLNFGRNFVYPTEAFYHLLVLLLLWAVLRGRIFPVLMMTALLVLSQPFTGLQCSLIVLAWAVFERFAFRSATVRLSHIFLAVCPLPLHANSQPRGSKPSVY